MQNKTDLAIRVTKAIAEDHDTRGAVVDVIDHNGVITLVGTAPSEEVKQAMSVVARQQEGVLSVIDDISLEEQSEEETEAGITPVAGFDPLRPY